MLRQFQIEKRKRERHIFRFDKVQSSPAIRGNKLLLNDVDDDDKKGDGLL